MYLLFCSVDLECHQKLRDYFMETWETLELTETLMDIAEPVFAKMEQQTTLVMKLLKTLGALTNPDTFNRCLINKIYSFVFLFLFFQVHIEYKNITTVRLEH